jgi:hypothetical protein
VHTMPNMSCRSPGWLSLLYPKAGLGVGSRSAGRTSRT